MNRPGWCALLFAPVAVGCRAPTQIQVTVSTDVACADVVGTSFTSGELAALESAPVTSESQTCSGSHLGSVVLVPSGSDEAVVGFKVVTSLNGRTLDFCDSDAGVGDTDCIVARRALRYLSHTPLDVRVNMEQACEGVVCDPTSTCAKGSCVPATIEDPSQCAGSGCGDSVLGDAGTDATLPSSDGAVDAPTSVDGSQANDDAGDGGHPDDGSEGGSPGAFSPATDCDLGGTEPAAAWPQTGGCGSHRNRSGYRVISKGMTLHTIVLDGGAIHRTPTISADGTIVLAEEGNVIQAFHPDGSLKWTYTDPSTSTVFKQPPTIAADGTARVYDNVSSVYVALDMATGSTLSRNAVTVLSDDGVARASGGIEYVVNNSNGSLEARIDGGLLWTGAAADDHVVPAVMPDHSVVVADDTGRVTRMFPDGGTGVTKVVVSDGTPGGLAIDPSGSLILAPDTAGNIVYAYDPTTLATVWSVPVGGAAQNLIGISVGDDGVTFAGTHASGLLRIGSDGGATSSYAADAGGCSQPTIDAAGTLVLWCDGAILALKADLSGTLWAVTAPGGVLIPDTPVIGPNGNVYFTGIPESGSTYALYFVSP